MVSKEVETYKTLCDKLNGYVEEELKTVFEYEELLEDMSIPEECKSLIQEIMEQEAAHAVKFRRIGIKLGCPEPKLVQQLENLLKSIEQQKLSAESGRKT